MRAMQTTSSLSITLNFVEQRPKSKHDEQEAELRDARRTGTSMNEKRDCNSFKWHVWWILTVNLNDWLTPMSIFDSIHYYFYNLLTLEKASILFVTSIFTWQLEERSCNQLSLPKLGKVLEHTHEYKWSQSKVQGKPDRSLLNSFADSMQILGLMADTCRHSVDQPVKMLRRQSARHQKWCMKPLQSLCWCLCYWSLCCLPQADHAWSFRHNWHHAHSFRIQPTDFRAKERGPVRVNSNRQQGVETASSEKWNGNQQLDYATTEWQQQKKSKKGTMKMTGALSKVFEKN